MLNAITNSQKSKTGKLSFSNRNGNPSKCRKNVHDACGIFNELSVIQNIT